MKAPTIEISNEYRLFKIMKGNRPIINNKIKNLIKSYDGGLNLFPFNPIIINNQNFVIDGQHRLEACKRLRLPVYYVVAQSVTLLQIAQLNAIASKWKMSDFFNCFIAAGNNDYKALEIFRDKYELPISVASALMMYGSPNEGGKGADAFREGKFTASKSEEAGKLMKLVYDYIDISDDGLLRDRSFIRAVHLLSKSSLYQHGDVIERLKKKKQIILKKFSHKEYIFHIEELYNTGNSKRYFIYEAPKK